MRILQIAPLAERVPPLRYGGTEAVVGLLADGLVRAGHDVVLWASGDSLTLAELRSVYLHGLRLDPAVADPRPYEWVHVVEAIKDAQGFDIIHNHDGERMMALASLVEVPMLTTMHCLIDPDSKFVWDRYRGFYNTVSQAERVTIPPLESPRFVGVVYNAVDVAGFPFRADKDDYLLFIGQIAATKGAHLAVEVARRRGTRLIIAGKIDPSNRQYFAETIEPYIDGKQIQFVGEVGYEKRELYANARCLLMPICWEEPFGLVMAEAMACGTPVIAFNRASAPELVVDGETGYIVRNVDEMAEAVGRLDRLNPYRCRQHVEERFDAPIMLQRYLEIYQRILTWETSRIQVTPMPVVPSEGMRVA
jgi:glycosyltransferase involved in cell wall biosynthesis